jgi:hypothetical protein
MQLEKLYRLAEWIVEDDLRSSDARNDFVSESESGSARCDGELQNSAEFRRFLRF